jgi:hypothetical protein
LPASTRAAHAAVPGSELVEHVTGAIRDDVAERMGELIWGSAGDSQR